MTWIDWTILVVAVVSLRFISLRTGRYMKGVADFLSANRSAGRYLLAIAGGMGSFGAISMIALFQQYYKAGFTAIWWGFILLPVGTIILLTGWVYYRFRETRALTMAQFLEMRYSRRFRVFSGFLIWLCGIVNFGIFPAVAARFFVYFCGLPAEFHLYSGAAWTIPTFVPIMALDLTLALTFVTIGGQISVMVTECAQGIVSAFVFLIITAVVLNKVGWTNIEHALMVYAPAKASMLNPFHIQETKDYTVWYYLISFFGCFYAASSWLGTQGFMTSGRSAHEQKMGGIIGVWRGMPLFLMLITLPLAGYAVLHLPEFSDIAAKANSIMHTIPNQSIQEEMRVPLVLSSLLPAGIKGLLATVMLFFSFTCHDTYMHSWGSIFVQDVIMPIRKKPMSPDQHIKWLRWSIISVAVFAFIFSWLYKPNEDILMFFAITGTIWAGGSGAVLIGGLYWRKGTTAAAYAALILGAAVGIGGLIIPKYWVSWYGHAFPITLQWLWMLAMLGAIVVYVVISLLTCRKHTQFNIEKMLRRGRYRVASEHVEERKTKVWLKILGVTPEFTIYDRILAVALVVWNLGWFSTFVVVGLIHLTHGVPTEWFAKFWRVYIFSQCILAVPATIWFTIGGVMDIRALFKSLAVAVRDDTDDGRVTHEADDQISLSERLTEDHSVH